MALFIIPYKVVLPFDSVDEILKCDHSYESYPTVFSSVVLFITPYKVVFTFEFVDEIMKCDRLLDESYHGTVYYSIQCVCYFCVCG